MHNVPINEYQRLKVLNSLTAINMPTDKALEALSTALKNAFNVEMGAVSLVAEGVETIEQAQTLQDMGCHQGQGYYFAKPMSASDCLKVMQKTLPIVG